MMSTRARIEGEFPDVGHFEHLSETIPRPIYVTGPIKSCKRASRVKSLEYKKSIYGDEGEEVRQIFFI
jgi:hypothetical protein